MLLCTAWTADGSGLRSFVDPLYTQVPNATGAHGFRTVVRTNVQPHSLGHWEKVYWGCIHQRLKDMAVKQSVRSAGQSLLDGIV